MGGAFILLLSKFNCGRAACATSGPLRKRVSGSFRQPKETGLTLYHISVFYMGIWTRWRRTWFVVGLLAGPLPQLPRDAWALFSPWISESWQAEASASFFLLPPHELLQRHHTHVSNLSSVFLASDSYIKPPPPLLFFFPPSLLSTPVSIVQNQVFFLFYFVLTTWFV